MVRDASQRVALAGVPRRMKGAAAAACEEGRVRQQRGRIGKSTTNPGHESRRKRKRAWAAEAGCLSTGGDGSSSSRGFRLPHLSVLLIEGREECKTKIQVRITTTTSCEECKAKIERVDGSAPSPVVPPMIHQDTDDQAQRGICMMCWYCCVDCIGLFEFRLLIWNPCSLSWIGCGCQHFFFVQTLQAREMRLNGLHESCSSCLFLEVCTILIAATWVLFLSHFQPQEQAGHGRHIELCLCM